MASSAYDSCAACHLPKPVLVALRFAAICKDCLLSAVKVQAVEGQCMNCQAETAVNQISAELAVCGDCADQALLIVGEPRLVSSQSGRNVLASRLPRLRERLDGIVGNRASNDSGEPSPLEMRAAGALMRLIEVVEETLSSPAATEAEISRLLKLVRVVETLVKVVLGQTVP